MTTEFVAMPANWTVEQALQQVRQLSRTKEPIYAIYVTDPDTQRMKANHGYVQGYNAQAVVDEGQLVIAALAHNLARWSTLGSVTRSV